MRIALYNVHRRHVGGVERYLEVLLAALEARGIETRLLYDTDEPVERARIALPAKHLPLCLAGDDRTASLDELAEWSPSLVFAHSIPDRDLAERLSSIAPIVFYVHTFAGTCISGLKMHRSPTAQPCARIFGPACLLLYHARRCGGLSPLTMVRDYRRQHTGLESLRSFDGVLTNSSFMRDECRRHGVDAESVPLFVDAPSTTRFSEPRTLPSDRTEVRLLFLGRMEPSKGGDLLVEALPIVRRRLGRPVHAVFAGDGIARPAWAERARRHEATDRDLTVEFVGWVDTNERDSLFRRSDLLVVPSVWPEPFGLVGLEAASFGLPAAAFEVGGIPEWLEDGRNGRLAEADPPTATGLAVAIEACLEPASYSRLSAGALAAPARFTIEKHLDRLVETFERTATVRAHS